MKWMTLLSRQISFSPLSNLRLKSQRKKSDSLTRTCTKSGGFLRNHCQLLQNYEANIKDFMFHLISRGYPVSLVKKHLGEVQFSDRHSALTQKNQTARKKILLFVMQYCPALPGLKHKLREKCQFIQTIQG